MYKHEPIWATVQEAKDAESDGELIAMALTNWAHCMAGNEPPKHFGEMMVVIGQRLGITPTPENISRKADEWKKQNGMS